MILSDSKDRKSVIFMSKGVPDGLFEMTYPIIQSAVGGGRVVAR